MALTELNRNVKVDRMQRWRFPAHTSRYLPYSTFTDAELPVRDFDVYLTCVHEENHLHAARVFALLDTHWRQLNNSSAKEIQRETFGQAKVSARHFPRTQGFLCESDVCWVVTSC